MRNLIIQFSVLIIFLFFNLNFSFAQEVEVQGELKVTQMTENTEVDDLVIRNTDGSLGTRSVASLPPPSPPIDSTRNLASDYELAKHLCDCGTNLPPFLIQSLLESGYTETDLIDAGIPYTLINNASFSCGDSLLDIRNGESYATVRFGGQCWFAQNLNIGEELAGSIPQDPLNSIIEKHCPQGVSANCITYGGLYHWNEMMQNTTVQSKQGICPAGWHLPSDDEYQTMEIYIGLTSTEADLDGQRGTDQGSRLAENEILWQDGLLDQNQNFGALNFGIVPSGYRQPSSSFDGFSFSTGLWTSTQTDSNNAKHRLFTYNSAKTQRFTLAKSWGFSVRCVQD